MVEHNDHMDELPRGITDRLEMGGTKAWYSLSRMLLLPYAVGYNSFLGFTTRRLD